MPDIQKNIMYALDKAVALTGPMEPIIVSGFWRSGTTWLQDLIAQSVQAKTIFEPLDKDAFMPFLRGRSDIYRGYIPPSPKMFSNADWRSLDRAFQGISPQRSGFCYLCRSGFKDAYKRRLVIKFVRAQFILGALTTRYQPSAAIHISRHPMAVVSSMLQANWNWSFDEIDLSQWYGADTQCGLENFAAQLMRTPLRGTHEKIAALWAVTEQAVHSVEAVTKCRYETLVTAPEETFAILMQEAALSGGIVPDFSKDSPVTTTGREGLAVQDRLTSWRRNLSSDMQLEIRAVLRDFWPQVEDNWDLT